MSLEREKQLGLVVQSDDLPLQPPALEPNGEYVNYDQMADYVQSQLSRLAVHGAGSGGFPDIVIHPQEEKEDRRIIQNEETQYSPGFIVYNVGNSKVSILGGGSVVSGLDDTYVPEISGTSIHTTPAPTITVSNNDIVSLKVEIEPDTEEYDTNQWRIIDSGFTVVNSRIDVVSQASASNTLPTINTSTGAVTQNGIYYIPLAKCTVDGDGEVTPEFKYYAEKGPIGVKFCSTGLLTIWGSIQIRFGSLQTFDDDA